MHTWKIFPIEETIQVYLYSYKVVSKKNIEEIERNMF